MSRQRLDLSLVSLSLLSLARRPAPFDPLDGDYRHESEAGQGSVKEAIEVMSVRATVSPVFRG